MTTYYGTPGDIASLPTPAAAVNIASSTNASPIVVTTAAAHGLAMNQAVIINGHATNTSANGIRLAVVLTPTTFSLYTLAGVAVAGVGVGGATGTSQSLGLPGITLPEDAVTDIDAASVNVPLEALADMTAWLAYKVLANVAILAGGTLSTDASASSAFAGPVAFTSSVTATNSLAVPGIEATGGAGEAGLSGIGGTGGAPGVVGVGTSNEPGVKGTGNGTGAGVEGDGGLSSGPGGIFTGGTANGAGVTAQGTGTGDGVVGAGGSSSGDGGTFTGGTTNGRGVVATGQGTGAGVVATGGSAGKGITCAAGASNVAALDVGQGNQIFTGTSTASGVDPGFNDYLCGANVPKAWARIQTDGAGNATLLDGYNVDTSITVSATRITLTFMRAFASANYAPVVSSAQFGGPQWAITDNQTTTTVDIRWIDATGATVDPSSGSPVSVAITVFGRQ